MQKSKIKNQNFRLKVKIFTFLIVILIFTFCILNLARSARAQTFSLGLYPPLLEVMIMPGKSITQVYQLNNYGDETILNTQILPFEPKDEQGNISLRGVTSREVTPPKEWFNFENADISLGKPFVLKSGESKQIILRIKIPENSREDDYYFTLLFQSQPQEKIGGSKTIQKGAIGANILLTVSRSGKPVKKGEIVEFKLRNCYIAKLLPSFCLFESFDKPEFLLRVKNTGRTFWKPFGKIEVKGLLGQRWEEELLPENVLMDSIRQIRTATESGKPNFLIGPYKAKVEFNLEEDQSGETLSSSLSFLALPIKFILGILISILILLTILKIIKNR